MPSSSYSHPGNNPVELDAHTISRYIGIFSGSIEAHGRFIPFKGKSTEGKQMGKSSLIKQPPIPQDYINHLKGDVGIGIVPVNGDGQCKFSVVDIDIYGNKQILDKILTLIDKLRLPFIPFFSKSGGLHLYTFFRDYLPAKQVMDQIRIIVSKSGLAFVHKHYKGSSNIEIFPKQDEIESDSGRWGSWINLPYFNCRSTDSPMLHLYQAGSEESEPENKWMPVEIEECISRIEENSEKVTLQYLKDVIGNIPNNDIPPCIQILQALPEEISPRNDYFFNLGILLRKQNPDTYADRLREANASIANPLPEEELEATILASLAKDDGSTYTYKCTVSPNVDFCNKEECKTRKYGIGDEGYFSIIDFGQLCQIEAIKPYYEWQVRVQGGEWVIMTFNDEKDLMYQDRFRQLCIRHLHIMPNKMKADEWFGIVAGALSNIEMRKLEGEEDDTPENLVRMFVIDFITQRVVGTTSVEMIKHKRVFYDESIDSYVFLKRALLEFLFLKNAQRVIGSASFNDIFKALQIRSIRKVISKNSPRIAVSAMPALVYDKLSVAPLFKLSELDDKEVKRTARETVKAIEKRCK